MSPFMYTPARRATEEEMRAAAWVDPAACVPHVCTAFCDGTGHVTGPLYGGSLQRTRWLIGKHVDSSSNGLGVCIEVVDVLPAPEAPPPTADFEWDEVTLLRFRFVEDCTAHP